MRLPSTCKKHPSVGPCGGHHTQGQKITSDVTVPLEKALLLSAWSGRDQACWVGRELVCLKGPSEELHLSLTLIWY